MPVHGGAADWRLVGKHRDEARGLSAVSLTASSSISPRARW